MANWASTSYAIEGPKETLEKIEQAILHHPTIDGSAESWEGNILKALNIEWENDNPDVRGYYMRGFLNGEDPWYDDNGALRFGAEEAWGTTDLHTVLEKNIPDIKVFYVTEESGEEIYATNDKDGKYFPERFYVDTCIDGEYKSEYFKTRKSALRWLANITHGRVKTSDDVESFNSDYEDTESFDENFIYIHEFKIVE